MKLKTNKILPLLAIGIVAFYFYSKKKKDVAASEPNKSDYAKMIVSSGNASSFAALMNYDEEYIKAWALAIKSGQISFAYNGKTYNTKGGKVKL